MILQVMWPPQVNKGLIASLIKGNQWLMSSDHKASYLLTGMKLQVVQNSNLIILEPQIPGLIQRLISTHP